MNVRLKIYRHTTKRGNQCIKFQPSSLQGGKGGGGGRALRSPINECKALCGGMKNPAKAVSGIIFIENNPNIVRL